jgi:subtilisin family serine protease
MTQPKPAVRVWLPALLALTLAHCKGDAGPTGWIPRNGSVTGTVTVTNSAALLSAPVSDPTAPAVALAMPSPTGLDVLRARRQAVPPASVRSRRRPSVASSELVVTFRAAALGAPAVGSTALRTARAAAPVARAIRTRLAAVLSNQAEVTGVSPAILAARVHVADPSRRDAIAAALGRDPDVANVATNHLLWLDQTPYYRAGKAATAAAAGVTPNNPLYPFQSWHYGLIDLPRAWTVGTGSATILVAVVDDGTRFDHPALAPNLTTDGYDFVSDADTLPLCAGGTITSAGDGQGYDPDPTIPAAYSPDSTGTCFLPDELGNHGSHVAGIIGAVGNSGIGVTGVNWHVSIRPVRVLGVGGFGTSYDVAQGVLYAAGLPADNGAGGTVQASTGARIINMSLGSPSDDTTLQRAVASATQAGALVVAAAGNDSTSQPFYPAAYPQVLAVAAVGPDAAPAPYSNFGSYVGIRAPGGNFALGDVTDGVMSAIWDFTTSSPEYAWATGTSMAAPHVSGVAALVLSQSPGLDPAQLRSRLLSYVVGPATSYGAGLVNAYNSVTASNGPAATLYARLYAGSDWATAQTVAADANGGFTFADVQDGTYHVYAGTDLGADEGLGSPGTMWGAYGGPLHPATIAVLGRVKTPVSFAIGFPTASANHSLQSAAQAVVGGYMQGHIVSPDTIDVYRIRIPQVGTYTFETSGWVAACGVALEEATAVGLFDARGNLLTFTGFIDQGRYNYCSRLTLNLNPGTYYIGVAGVFGYRYRVQARAGRGAALCRSPAEPNANTQREE